ncbi:hypothetical protein GCM10027059_50680 [Myceligenerans halotolerans]
MRPENVPTEAARIAARALARADGWEGPLRHAPEYAGGRYDREARHALAAAWELVEASALRNFADYLDGGTPRAWGYHHPCDEPGERWEPSSQERERMADADTARERADRLETAAKAAAKD